jgi:hypothetical protein
MRGQQNKRNYRILSCRPLPLVFHNLFQPPPEFQTMSWPFISYAVCNVLRTDVLQVADNSAHCLLQQLIPRINWLSLYRRSCNDTSSQSLLRNRHEQAPVIFLYFVFFPSGRAPAGVVGSNPSGERGCLSWLSLLDVSLDAFRTCHLTFRHRASSV